MKLKYEWPLDEFLDLQEVVEVMDSVEMARHKDQEIEMKNNK